MPPGVVVERELLLTGALKGRTIRLGNVDFVDGRARIRGPVQDVESLHRYLHRCWEVATPGEVRDGQRELHPAGEAPRDPVPPLDGGAPPAVAGPEGEPADEGGGADEDEADTSAKAAAQRDALRGAALGLDPDDDEHWTAAGRPSVSALSRILKRPVTRREIELAAGDVVRAEEG